MDNLISIMQAESTLKRVCLRLFARVLIQGNPDRETNGITVSSYTTTYNHLKNSPNGNEILKLIDKSSEDKTVSNLEKYMRPHKENYIYGLFYYIHPFYSYNALKNIKVQTTITFPFAVIDSNGKLQEDNHTVIWDAQKLQQDQQTRLYAVFDNKNSNSAPAYTGAVDGIITAVSH